ncbi:hypothetical protein [Bifidobacterium jacchi]|uniref:Uncharacterized protein n=1 Tax=Bifidobacterium jacchi TaxID=2490545 RepID=A0A5N5RIQ9_9BIFI|nr:hypothetical protein [Bifidobacterium jacchi]KAB5607186.1 hypothetical protein EHS19_05445 [Bifidobacterium jacchi]
MIVVVLLLAVAAITGGIIYWRTASQKELDAARQRCNDVKSQIYDVQSDYAQTVRDARELLNSTSSNDVSDPSTLSRLKEDLGHVPDNITTPNCSADSVEALDSERESTQDALRNQRGYAKTLETDIQDVKAALRDTQYGSTSDDYSSDSSDSSNSSDSSDSSSRELDGEAFSGTYTNDEYGYSIDIPSGFEWRDEQSDSVRKLIDTDTDMLIRIDADDNPAGLTPQSALAELKNHDDVSFATAKGSMVAGSWKEGSIIMYVKEYVTDSRTVTMTITYSQSVRSKADKLVEKISPTFTIND